MAIIPDDCEFIDEETFKNYKNLLYIKILNSVKIIKNGAFEGCKSLEEIEIPKSVLEISDNAFLNCNNLVKIECNPKFLNVFQNNKIKELSITENITQKQLNDLNNLKKFKYLEKINIPSKIKKIPDNILKDCANLTQINCSPDLLKNLNKEDKNNLREIEIPNNQNIDIDTFKGFDNVYNIQLPINTQLPNNKNDIHETSIEDLERYDSNNIRYSKHIRNIISSINKGFINFSGSSQSLEDISSKIAEVCLKIKTSSSKKFTPHPVQCLTVLRLCDSLLNNNSNKGAIAEVKTGEGKSYIIAVIAIVLAKFYGKKIDVVTSTVELARRDEEDQREFYNLFNIKSGVLFDKNRDKDFIGSDNMIRNNDEDNNFNSEVFSYEIVYSTNSNFEFVYLYSLFRKNPIRSRPYDVVIVDEVDNMFLDQASSPAIIANSFPIKFANDILEIVYIMQNYSLNDIKNTLEYYFPEGVANFTDEEIEKMKKAAIIASKHEYKVDYIIENNEVVIIDKTTGYKKLGSRWQNFIHEMVEIKEKLKIKSNQLSFCSITQSMFFNLYKKIIGVTGTIGDVTDETLLKNSYNVNVFKIPRNKAFKKPIYSKPRPSQIEDIYSSLAEEVLENCERGRPVLVILDSPKHVEEFVSYIGDDICLTIKGINASEDRKAIQKAGESGSITIATSAAGRGMDIKPSKESLKAGGLHVIIPFNMPNRRVLEQAIGRSARQGQPGSATVYSPNNNFYKTPEFKPLYLNLMKIQNNFSQYIRTNWPWIYDCKKSYSLSNAINPFGVTVEKFLEIYSKAISESKIDLNSDNGLEQYISYYNQMVFKSWGLFYSSIKSDSLEECLRRYYSFINLLSQYLKPLTKNVSEQIDFLNSKKDWTNFIILGIEIIGSVCCLIFPEVAPLIIIGQIILQGGVRIYQQLSNGEKINWGSILLEALGTGICNFCLPGTGRLLGKAGSFFGKFAKYGKKVNQFLNSKLGGKAIFEAVKNLEKIERKELMKFAGCSLGNYLSSCSEGNCGVSAIASSIVDSGIDYLHFNTLKKVGKNFMTIRKMKKNNYKPRGFLDFENIQPIKENKIIKNVAKGAIKSLSTLLDGLNKGDFSMDLVVDIIIDGGYKGINSAFNNNNLNMVDLNLNEREKEAKKKITIEAAKEALKGLIKDTLNGNISFENLLNHLQKGGFKGFKGLRDEMMK